MGRLGVEEGSKDSRKVLNGGTEHSDLGQEMRYYDQSSLDHVSIIFMAQKLESIPRKKERRGSGQTEQ